MKNINTFCAVLFCGLLMYSLANANLQFLPDTEDIGFAGNQAPDSFTQKCSGYNLFACPDNANCSQCSNGKFRLDSCKTGYVRKDNVCIKP